MTKVNGSLYYHRQKRAKAKQRSNLKLNVHATMVFILSNPPFLDISAIDRMIGLVLYYSSMRQEMKNVVDQAILSHFDGGNLWARLTDPELAYLILVALTTLTSSSSSLCTTEYNGRLILALKRWFLTIITNYKLMQLYFFVNCPWRDDAIFGSMSFSR